MAITPLHPLLANRLTDHRQELVSLLRSYALTVAPEGKAFKLTSGRTSPYLFVLKRLMFMPHAAPLIAEAFLHQLQRMEAKQIGGLEGGAIPLIATIIAHAETEGLEHMRGCYVRHTPKSFGPNTLVDGWFEPEATTIIIEDITTTGTNVLKAAEALRASNSPVKQAVCLLDRGEGAQEMLASYGIELIPLVTLSDFNLHQK